MELQKFVADALGQIKASTGSDAHVGPIRFEVTVNPRLEKMEVCDVSSKDVNMNAAPRLTFEVTLTAR